MLGATASGVASLGLAVLTLLLRKVPVAAPAAARRRGRGRRVGAERAMRAAIEVEGAPAAARVGDVFVLHPRQRPDACLALSGQELLRLKAVLDGVAGTSRRGELSEVARTIADRLGRYFAGLK